MPYILLIIGALLGFYGLIRFADKANTAQMKKLFEALFALVLTITLLYLVLSERLGLIVLWLIVALPFFFAAWRKRKLAQAVKEKGNAPGPDETLQ